MQYIVRLTFPKHLRDAVDKHLLDKPDGVSVSFLEMTGGKLKPKRS